VVALLTAVWQAPGYPWSVRLKALLPLWMLRKYYRVRPEMERQLLWMSARQNGPAAEGPEDAPASTPQQQQSFDYISNVSRQRHVELHSQMS
jgi:hypothetical protein